MGLFGPGTGTPSVGFLNDIIHDQSTNFVELYVSRIRWGHPFWILLQLLALTVEDASISVRHPSLTTETTFQPFLTRHLCACVDDRLQGPKTEIFLSPDINVIFSIYLL